MSVFHFEIATKKDDQELQSILARTAMDGKISVSFRREPSYFDALEVEGSFSQIVAARNQTDGKLVGFGTRSISNKYVKQVAQPVGYLSNLRLLKQFRGSSLIARGYRFFKKLHQDNRTPFYLTTIAEGNHNAIKLLTSKRTGLPCYKKIGKYITLAIPLKQRKLSQKDDPTKKIKIRQATIADKIKIIQFLDEEGSKKEFFPKYQVDDLFTDHGLLKGLKPTDIRLAIEDQEIVGILGAWNQQRFKQTVVEKYHYPLKLLRPFYNIWAKIAGAPKLPNPGESIQYLSAALTLARNNNLNVFQDLLETQLMACSGGSETHLMVGLHEADPLYRVIKKISGIRYTTNLYLVSWEEEYCDFIVQQLGNRVPYLELGGL